MGVEQRTRDDQQELKDEVDFKIVLARQIFDYDLRRQESTFTDEEESKCRADIVEKLKEREMGPVYERVCAQLGWDVDDMVLSSMKEVNEKKIREIDDAITNAKENEGEMEVRDAMVSKADYYAQVGDQSKAGEAFEEAVGKTAGSGPKLDLSFSLLRLHLSLRDWVAYKKELEKAWDLCSKGGDWERKNKLKVYEALYLMATRQFEGAAELFLNSIATFTATELMSYESCVFYTVVLAVVSLDRPALLAKVVENPEILAAIDAVPHLRELLMSLYQCQYALFFKSLVEISDVIKTDMLLHPHYRYYLKEARVVVYSQYLQSYKSVKMTGMASAFGVSVDFIDDELSNMIVEGRLPAKLDRVDGVIYTTRPDPKNAAYQQTIRQGDHLLNKLQKLSKLTDVE
ncbi:26S proteasome non-ATPase regulatory subunit 6 [Picochlorum sp. SENEW3]|nr:26S proteasome non-ATPase regulatory subunit 6 [Picochlorum sp. SENEW3]WPT14915.1 26S proteasome non-ATPase regulatory subunit 6 [Picochlorum sp. SENEW3]